jgi:D-alanyl-D-alanine carboxypeptidase
MSRHFLCGILILTNILVSCHKNDISSSAPCVADFADSSALHPKAKEYQAIIDSYVKKGLPGIVLLIEDAHGTWIGEAGKADINKGVDMAPCTVSKIASITKLYIGTLMLKLQEEGVLSLDDQINKYLPEHLISDVNNANVCTIRQLLNHTSGIYDIISDQGFYLALLNNPEKKWQPEELLKFAHGKPAVFSAGAGVSYSNTNFLLASMIINYATGEPHDRLLSDKIINLLNLKHTYYYPHNNLLETTAQGYFDLYNNGSIENLTNYNTGSGNGYGGIYATVNDMRIFLNALLVSKTILNTSSLQQMLTFTEEEKDAHRSFGMGIFKDFLERAPDEFAYGHRGRDLAYSADLFFFPKNGTIMAFLVNYGTNGKSSLKDVFLNFRTAVADEIFR